MAPRLATRPTRDNDFSDVGKVGRRTGVTLPQGRLDVNGMEEISGIFSSPRKPSPLRKSMSVMDSVEEDTAATTPQPPQTRSTRRSIPPPRSASPRKSGISGTARRKTAVDLFGQSEEKDAEESVENILDNPPVLTPSLTASKARRFSPAKTPLPDGSVSGLETAQTTRLEPTQFEDSVHESVETTQDPTEIFEETVEPVIATNVEDVVDEYVLPAVGDDDDRASVAASQEDEPEERSPPPQFDDEDADQTFEPEQRAKSKPREPTVANSRRKRKSDTLEQEVETEAISSPAAKRAKRISDQSTSSARKKDSAKTTAAKTTSARPRGRPPMKDKDTNTKLTSRQEDELNNIVDKIKARPGQKRSLYILKREQPTNDSATHTRSGRVSVKPLAYWRNERCVFGGSPGGAGLQDGARFPLNSIKEIIRTEEVVAKSDKMSGKPAKSKSTSKKKGKSQKRSSQQEDAGDDMSESEQESTAEDQADPDADEWEVEKGIFRGTVATWDSHQQTQSEEGEEEIDIAYAPASIETREVKGSTFRYAKMLSMKFFGSGIVDLPPGGVKRPKNSRKMHMSFFVASGRVTVQVGALDEPGNRFSIGQGGWWQVPRGNWYAIENELSKPARVFFSQASESVSRSDDD